MTQCYKHIEVIELLYTLMLIPSMDFYTIPTMTSTPHTELIKPMLMELECAAVIARRLGELEPDYLSFDSWLKQEFVVNTSNWSVTWSWECQRAIASELKHMD